MKKELTMKKYFAIVLGLVLFLSCDKDTLSSNSPESGVARVKVTLQGSEADDKSNNDQASNGKRSSLVSKNISGQEIQISSVSFTDEMVLEAVLTPDNIDFDNTETRKQHYAGRNPQRKAAVVRTPIPANVRYKLVVYDDQGKYVTQVNYPSEEELLLDAGKRYTFVAYSVGSTSELPELDTDGDLEDAVLTNVEGRADFMIDIVEKDLVEGNNQLNLVLKHKFSQITTVIDGSALGNIQTISNARFTPHNESVDVRLSNGSLTYKSLTSNAVGSPVSFTAGDAQVKTSAPTIISHSQTNAGALRIAGLAIGGETRSNIIFNNLEITPGQRYTLRIRIKSPFELTPGLIWASGNLIDVGGTNYYFDSPSGVGSYFPFGKLRAYNQVSYASNGNGDPCEKVTIDGGGWRTPTSGEFLQLQSKRYVFTNQNNVPGALYDNKVFLPAVSYSYWDYSQQRYYRYPENSGYYWASDNLHHGYFTNQMQYTSTATWNYPQYPEAGKSGLPIRCVKPINNN